MPVNYAEIQTKQAYLSEDFGLGLAMKKSGLSEDGLEELVGRYKKGKRKGKLRGAVRWFKCIKGGWVKTGGYDWDGSQGTGFVLRPGSYNFSLVDAWTGALIAAWGVNGKQWVSGLDRAMGYFD